MFIEKAKSKVVTNCDHLEKLKYSKSLPYAFTEHGAIMAANVLRSEQAIEMSVFIVRAFVKLRVMLSTHKKLASRPEQLDKKLEEHDKDINEIVDAIKSLMEPQKPANKRNIGFKADKKNK